MSDRIEEKREPAAIWTGPRLVVPAAPTVQAATRALPLLERAHELVSRPGGWTQAVWARAGNGRPVDVSSEKAVRFCIGGAVLRAASERYGIEITSGGSEPDVFEEAAAGRTPAGLAAALWALSWACASVVWTIGSTYDALLYASIDGQAEPAAFLRLSGAVNDVKWMNARLATKALALAPEMLKLARKAERDRRAAAKGGASPEPEAGRKRKGEA